MIRRSERPAMTTTSNGVIHWRVIRYKVFGFLVYESQIELDDPWMRPRPTRVASPGPPTPDDTAEFRAVAPANGGAKS